MAQELTSDLVTRDIESFLTVRLAVMLNHRVSIRQSKDENKTSHILSCSCGIQVGIQDVPVLTIKHPLLEEALKIMAENHK